MNVSGAEFGKTSNIGIRSAAKKRVCAKCVYGGSLKPRQKREIEFLIGGVGYGLIELLWRGETHWSMVLTGGACLLAICAVNRRFCKRHLLWRATACAVIITLVEFCVGVLVNRLLGLGVWDYSSMLGNVMGQICPLYSFFWFLLSLPVCAVVKRMKN